MPRNPEKLVAVYTLVSPDDGLPWYGGSSQTPELRYEQYLREARGDQNSPTYQAPAVRARIDWINSLSRSPVLNVIAWVPVEMADLVENAAIDGARGVNPNLLNRIEARYTKRQVTKSRRPYPRVSQGVGRPLITRTKKEKSLRWERDFPELLEGP